MSSQPARSALTVRLVAAGLLGALALMLIWQAAALPVVCPAIYPAPASCFGAPRMPWAWAGTGVAVTGLLLVATASLPRRESRPGRPGPRRALVVSGAWLLGLSAVVFPLVVAYSGGFGIDLAQITLVLAAFAVSVALAGVVARTSRDRAAADQVS